MTSELEYPLTNPKARFFHVLIRRLPIGAWKSPPLHPVLRSPEPVLKNGDRGGFKIDHVSATMALWILDRIFHRGWQLVWTEPLWFPFALCLRQAGLRHPLPGVLVLQSHENEERAGICKEPYHWSFVYAAFCSSSSSGDFLPFLF